MTSGPPATLAPSMGDGDIDISVVVPSHGRPLRLRWLLNALEEQTLAPDRWELVVGHSSPGPETTEMLRTHPLAAKVSVRGVHGEPAPAPGRNRNRAWPVARGRLIAFTDDDCRPAPEWLERVLAAAERHPGAIIQGATAPDWEERTIVEFAPWFHTRSIAPPQPWAQACNIVYPREVLEAAGGFPEDLWGEDTALAENARAAGVEYVGARDAVVYHAVIERTLPGMMRDAWRFRNLPLLIRRYPRLRRDFHLWIFYTRQHALLPPALLGWMLMRRSRLASLLIVPYLIQTVPRKYGQDHRARARALMDLPGWVTLHLFEMASLAWGSIKHRTLFL